MSNESQRARDELKKIAKNTIINNRGLLSVVVGALFGPFGMVAEILFSAKTDKMYEERKKKQGY